MSVGQRVKAIRKRLGLSQTDFAVKLNLNQGTLSHIEQDDPNYPISKKTAAGLKSMFKVNMDYLFNGGDEPMFMKGLKPEDLVSDSPGVYESHVYKEVIKEKDEYIRVLKELMDYKEKLQKCEQERAELQRKLNELTSDSDDRLKRKV